jgi:hypothetical protein
VIALAEQVHIEVEMRPNRRIVDLDRLPARVREAQPMRDDLALLVQRRPKMPAVFRHLHGGSPSRMTTTEAAS